MTKTVLDLPRAGYRVGSLKNVRIIGVEDRFKQKLLEMGRKVLLFLVLSFKQKKYRVISRNTNKGSVSSIYLVGEEHQQGLGTFSGLLQNNEAIA